MGEFLLFIVEIVADFLMFRHVKSTGAIDEKEFSWIKIAVFVACLAIVGIIFFTVQFNR
ncbi:MAG: hypothetical protein ACKVOE_01985 [Rickettsiales bacterium]